LHHPLIPAPGRDTLRQNRAGLATKTAKKSANGDGVQFATGSVGFAQITAMSPEMALATVWATLGAAGFRVAFQQKNILRKGTDIWQDSRHGRAPFFEVKFLIWSHIKNGVPTSFQPPCLNLLQEWFFKTAFWTAGYLAGKFLD
jgi:hypothetical protein